MGVLSNHVPSIEQLKPGLIEIVEENGSTKQLFSTSDLAPRDHPRIWSLNANKSANNNVSQ
jgi:F-type H+-transporting ATPase subunit delta